MNEKKILSFGPIIIYESQESSAKKNDDDDTFNDNFQIFSFVSFKFIQLFQDFIAKKFFTKLFVQTNKKIVVVLFGHLIEFF